MSSLIKFKGLFGDNWRYGGAYCDGDKNYIVDENGEWLRVYKVCQYTGLSDRDGTDIYENDLMAFIVERYERDEYGDEVRVKRLILIQIVRGSRGYSFEVRRGDEYYDGRDFMWHLNKGKVVGNYLDCDDINEFYDMVKKEMIEND